MKKQIRELLIVGFLSCLILNICSRTANLGTESCNAQETSGIKLKPLLKYRVAVIDFEDKTKYGQARLGSSSSDILTTELVKTGNFIVVERQQLQKVLEEQKLQQSGLIQQESAIAVGKLLGLNAIITGSVSQFGTKVEGEDALFVQTKRQVAEAVVDVRVIDVQTGKILYADSGKGVAKKESGAFLGIGSQSGYDETLGGKALRGAITQFVDNVISYIKKEPWFCWVAEVEGNKIYLDAGAESGLQIGTRLEVYHLGKEIRSPSGTLLGRIEEKTGEIKVVKYFGANGSIAEGESGTTPSREDMCRLAEK